MIKINLLKSSNIKQSKKKSNSDDFSSEFASSSNNLNKSEISPAVKILILFLGPAALFAYEQRHIPGLQNQYNEKQHDFNDLKTYNSKEVGAVKEIDTFKKNKEKLETQIRSIEALSQNRLLFVKSLETLQVSIPEKAWLTKVADTTKFKEETSNDLSKTSEAPHYKLEIEGIALSEVEISNFIDALTRNIHFLDVSLVSADEASEKHVIYGDKGKSQSVSVKKFKIECSLDPNRDNKNL
jgi:type IV pilus assembly protein PilN